MEEWQPVDMEISECRYWHIGTLNLWVKRTENEWHIAREYDSGESVSGREIGEDLEIAQECEDPPADLTWDRWATRKTSGKLRIVPVMPDRPVVVRPESPVRIPPDENAQFYVGMPVWLRLSMEGDASYTICELPSVILSNIWFGDPMSGELCYSLETRARRTPQVDHTRRHNSVCMLKLSNVSDEELIFERLCIRVQHLNVYEGESHIWATRVNVSFRGSDSISQVEYNDSPPKYEHLKVTLSEAREPFDPRLLERTFSHFRSIAGI